MARAMERGNDPGSDVEMLLEGAVRFEPRRCKPPAALAITIAIALALAAVAGVAMHSARAKTTSNQEMEAYDSTYDKYQMHTSSSGAASHFSSGSAESNAYPKWNPGVGGDEWGNFGGSSWHAGDSGSGSVEKDTWSGGGSKSGGDAWHSDGGGSADGTAGSSNSGSDAWHSGWSTDGTAGTGSSGSDAWHSGYTSGGSTGSGNSGSDAWHSGYTSGGSTDGTAGSGNSGSDAWHSGYTSGGSTDGTAGNGNSGSDAWHSGYTSGGSTDGTAGSVNSGSNAWHPSYTSGGSTDDTAGSSNSRSEWNAAYSSGGSSGDNHKSSADDTAGSSNSGSDAWHSALSGRGGRHSGSDTWNSVNSGGSSSGSRPSSDGKKLTSGYSSGGDDSNGGSKKDIGNGKWDAGSIHSSGSSGSSHDQHRQSPDGTGRSDNSSDKSSDGYQKWTAGHMTGSTRSKWGTKADASDRSGSRTNDSRSTHATKSGHKQQGKSSDTPWYDKWYHESSQRPTTSGGTGFSPHVERWGSSGFSPHVEQRGEGIEHFGYGDAHSVHGSGSLYPAYDPYAWFTPKTGTTATSTPRVYPPVPTITKYVNHYEAANPLNITAARKRSDNYFLILGDWGKPGSPGSCQRQVAAKMRAYAQAQKLAGKKLLFIASVGDNFYWTGATPAAWDKVWAEPYGVHDQASPFFHVPWLSVYGNHDFGSNDPHAFCPHRAPRNFVGKQRQPYASHQLNRDKYPDRPRSTDHYWLPDYNYHYELPAANLEVIAIDTNGKVDPNIIGGDQSGRRLADLVCGGKAVGDAFLQTVAQAGVELLLERARNNTAGTVLLIQHYPGQCPRGLFESALPPARKGKVKVLCAYGHDHTQACDMKDPSGLCVDILSGGGGGCCAPVVNLAGFGAVHLDEQEGVQSVVVESDDVRLPMNSCEW
ncbi:unnamed protein product [Effrenium voratum]|nr:unnamed protein product [Effrenium voratum]